MALNSNVSRRSFVKMAALAGAAAAIGTQMTGSLVEAPAAYADEVDDVKVVKTCCHGCIQVCPALATIKNGVVVKLEGDPDAPQSRGSLCIKGLNQLHTMYSPRRILHPLKRVGERGTTDFEVISWDEAIELAATQITGGIDKYGPYAFFASVGGGGSYSFAEAKSLPQVFGSPTVFEPGCAQCYLPRVAIGALMWGGDNQSIADCSVKEIFRNEDNVTDLVVSWAAQPSVSQSAQSGRGMAELREAGCKTIVVDPNFSPDAAKADVWLPVRPGADTGLILSWLRYIFENKAYDERATKYWTNMPFLIDPDTKLPVKAQELFPDFKQTTPDNTPAYVCYDLKTGSVQPFEYSAPEDSAVDPEIFWEGEYEGKTYKTAGQIYWEEADPWTLEHAEEITWVPADLNEKAIKLYIDTPNSGIANGVALDMTESASQGPLGLMAIDFIMGRFNRPGVTLTSKKPTSVPTVRPTYQPPYAKYGASYIIGMSDAENEARVADKEAFPQKELAEQILYDRLGMQNHKGLYHWEHSHIPTVREAIATGEPYKPRVWYDLSGNKLAMLGNAKSWYDVFPEVDFIIGQYPMLTSFHIEAADLVLPMREWLEEPMARSQQEYNFIQNECTHIGETVSHSVGMVQIVEKCKEIWGGTLPGLEGALVGKGTEAEIKESVAASVGAPSWEELQADVEAYVPMKIEDYWHYNQHETIVDDGLPAGFATESRKIEVYCQALLKMARTGYPYCFTKPQEACEDYSPICCYIEPVESPLTDEEYPFSLTSGRLPYFHHGTMRHAAFSRELYPAPDVRINPKSAAELGIEHGEWVKVTSRRGEIAGRAYLTEGVAPGVVWMERFWNPECFDESVPAEKRTAGWREMNVNVLTKNTAPFNEVFGSYTNRGFQVKVEKGEKPENVWIEPKEFQPFMPTLQSEPVTKDVF